MHDISRGKAPSMNTLYALIDRLASWKINQFQLYMEHTFAYQEHEEVWRHASPMTAEEILALDAYCRERHIDLAPNQNSFGHMERWFEHARYRHLAEVEAEFTAPWGMPHLPTTLSPAVPETLPFIESLYAELLPNFSSKLFNIGCDETFELGMGRSKTLVEQKGRGRFTWIFFWRSANLRRRMNGPYSSGPTSSMRAASSCACDTRSNFVSASLKMIGSRRSSRPKTRRAGERSSIGRASS